MARKCRNCGGGDVPVRLQCMDCGSFDVMINEPGEPKPDGWDGE